MNEANRAGSGELSCREVVELVTDYLEGALSEDDRGRFEAHLAICDGCVNYIGQMEATMRVTGTLTEDSIPPEAVEPLVQAFRDYHRS